MSDAIRVPAGLTSMAEIVQWSGIGSSEIAGVLGISPWDKPWEIYARHRGLIGQKHADARMRCGKAFQQPIARLFTEDTGIPHQWSDQPYNPPERPWQRASVDAFIPNVAKKQAILEVKTAGLERAGDWGRPEPGELIGDESGVPEYYLAQTQWQMNAHDLPVAYIALEINHELRYYRVDADPAVQEWLLTQAEAFWQRHILAGVEPPPGASEEFRRYLHRRHPHEKAPIRPATSLEIDLLDAYAEVRTELSPRLKRKKELESLLKQAVGDAAGLEWAWGKFTWKKSRDKQTVNWERLAKSQIDSYPADVQATMKAEYTETKAGDRRIYFKDLRREEEEDDEQ